MNKNCVNSSQHVTAPLTQVGMINSEANGGTDADSEHNVRSKITSHDGDYQNRTCQTYKYVNKKK